MRRSEDRFNEICILSLVSQFNNSRMEHDLCPAS